MKITCLLIASAAAAGLRVGGPTNDGERKLSFDKMDGKKIPPPLVANFRDLVLAKTLTNAPTEATATTPTPTPTLQCGTGAWLTAYENSFTATCVPAQQQCLNAIEAGVPSDRKSALCLPEGACMLFISCVEGVLKRTGCARSRGAGDLKAQCTTILEVLGPGGPINDGKRKLARKYPPSSPISVVTMHRGLITSDPNSNIAVTIDPAPARAACAGCSALEFCSHSTGTPVCQPRLEAGGRCYTLDGDGDACISGNCRVSLSTGYNMCWLRWKANPTASCARLWKLFQAAMGLQGACETATQLETEQGAGEGNSQTGSPQPPQTSFGDAAKRTLSAVVLDVQDASSFLGRRLPFRTTHSPAYTDTSTENRATDAGRSLHITEWGYFSNFRGNNEE